METVSTLRMEGVATALSSISHGGEHTGTVQLLRRERFVQPSGEVVEIPVVSGNALRGLLRDHSADLLWRQLGCPELPMAVFHALFSGGALTKAGAGNVMSSHQLRTLRRLVPHVALFGAAGGGRIIEGKLSVGKLVPICAETAHVVPPGSLPEKVESVWSLLQIEEFSRMDDSKRGWSDRYLGRGEAPALDAGTLLVDAPPDPKQDDGPAQQMRYGAETIASGTRFHFWLMLTSVTDLEHEAFLLALASWSRSGAHVGGRSSTGHGRLRLDCESFSTAGPTLTGTGVAPQVGERLAAHTLEHSDEIMEAVGWLA